MTREIIFFFHSPISNFLNGFEKINFLTFSTSLCSVKVPQNIWHLVGQLSAGQWSGCFFKLKHLWTILIRRIRKLRKIDIGELSLRRRDGNKSRRQGSWIWDIGHKGLEATVFFCILKKSRGGRGEVGGWYGRNILYRGWGTVWITRAEPLC